MWVKMFYNALVPMRRYCTTRVDIESRQVVSEHFTDQRFWDLARFVMLASLLQC